MSEPSTAVQAEVERLEPCPFCGGPAEFERKGTPRYSTIVVCQTCGCRLETGEEWDHGKDWNRRHQSVETAITAADVAEMVCKFGSQTREELDAARLIATAVNGRYGDFENDAIWETFRKNGIWNDHTSVQAALVAIRLMARPAVAAALQAKQDENALTLEALKLAVDMLVVHEPGDSRAVSDEFVALAAVSCGMPDTDGEYARIIGSALNLRTALNPTPASTGAKHDGGVK